ncbi:hypothetical protein GCM10027418_04860 [Mariniluteicoccus endophyticus]
MNSTSSPAASTTSSPTNHRLLATSTHLGLAYADGLDLYDYGPFPYAAPGDGQICGDLFDVDARTLQRLDHLEGFDPRSPQTSHYTRETREVRTPAGITVRAWIYLAGPHTVVTHYPRISSGDWNQR